MAVRTSPVCPGAPAHLAGSKGGLAERGLEGMQAPGQAHSHLPQGWGWLSTSDNADREMLFPIQQQPAMRNGGKVPGGGKRRWVAAQQQTTVL